MREIERKFLVKKLPNISRKAGVPYERYFLKIQPGYEERIQKKGNIYEWERKTKKSDLSWNMEKQQITKKKFEELKKSASQSILRESYRLSASPNFTIKIYHGDYEGLIRAEIEFSSEEDAKNFTPFDWLGKEITNTALGNDSRLIKLDKKKFKKLLDPLERQR